MRSETIGWARLAVRQQVEIFGGDQVSLNSLWRAVASPAGHDPDRWSELAAPLLAGFSAYLERLDGRAESPAGPSRLLWTWEDESKDPWRTGDLMSHELIAWTYATYLDSRFERPVIALPIHSSLIEREPERPKDCRRGRGVETRRWPQGSTPTRYVTLCERLDRWS